MALQSIETGLDRNLLNICLHSNPFVWLGNSRQASPDYIQELERQRLNISFDEQINYNQSLASLDLTPLQARFSQAGKVLNDDKLLNLRLIQREQGRDYPTHGLLILLGQYEHVETKCSRFKGNTMAVFLDKKEYRGDLFYQLEQTELFIKNHLHLKAEILGLQRTESYEIPMPAIREALVNAVLHRDYSNFGRDIKVGIYDGMLNVVSPGGLPNGLTEADLQQGRSEIRNRVLARVFKELGYIEQWGSGIGRIKAMCREAGNAEPKIQERGDFVDWEFYRSAIGKAELVTDSKKVSEKMSEKIVRFIQANPNITIDELAKLAEVSTRTIERNLKSLQADGRVKRIGPAKGGYWEVE